MITGLFRNVYYALARDQYDRKVGIYVEAADMDSAFDKAFERSNVHRVESVKLVAVASNLETRRTT
jgi:hypothetical protein